MVHRVAYPSGNSQDDLTCVTANNPAAATPVVLDKPSETIYIQNNDTAAVLWVNLKMQANGTVANAVVGSGLAIGPGRSYQYIGPPITSFNVIASAATGTFSVVAF